MTNTNFINEIKVGDEIEDTGWTGYWRGTVIAVDRHNRSITVQRGPKSLEAFDSDFNPSDGPYPDGHKIWGTDEAWKRKQVDTANVETFVEDEADFVSVFIGMNKIEVQ